MPRETKSQSGTRLSADYYLKLAATAIAVAGTFFAITQKFYELRQDQQRLEEAVLPIARIEQILNETRARLAADVESEVNSQIAELRQPQVTEANTQARVAALEMEFEHLQEVQQGLRQALNPISPEEVLTIARLNDEVKRLSGSLQRSLDDLAEDQEEFQTAVRREIDASDKTLNLVLVVLVPLVLNLLYSFWQDRRREVRAEKADKPELKPEGTG